MYALQDLGWTDSHTTDFEPHAAEGRIPARVAAQHRGAYVVFSELGELRADTAGRLSHEAAGAGELPAVGDWVAIAPRPEEGAATIHAVVSRRTKFSRKVAINASEEQVLAANIDAVFLVMSLNEDYNLRRLERYVTMAWESGAQPVIVLTKTDLCPDWELRVLEVEAIALGVPVHAISNVSEIPSADSQSCSSRIPGVSRTSPPPGSSTSWRCVVVWRPSPSSSRIVCVASSSSPASVFTSVDLPTPEEPSSAIVRPGARCERIRSSPTPVRLEIAWTGTPKAIASTSSTRSP